MDELKDLDCTKALDSLLDLQPPIEDNWESYSNVMDFILKVNKLQRKYTKPVAALLKGPNG